MHTSMLLCMYVCLHVRMYVNMRVCIYTDSQIVMGISGVASPEIVRFMWTFVMQ